MKKLLKIGVVFLITVSILSFTNVFGITDDDGDEIVGTIKIPTLEIEQSIYSKITTSTLTKGVAILTTSGLNEPGNTVIAGHNYQNGTFFSDLNKIEIGDYIYITDENETTVCYSVYNIYEASSDDTAYLSRDTDGETEITLQTSSSSDTTMRFIVYASKVGENLDDETENTTNNVANNSSNSTTNSSNSTINNVVNNVSNNSSSNIVNNTIDNTVSKTLLPNTGLSIRIITAIIVISILISLVIYVKIKKYDV